MPGIPFLSKDYADFFTDVIIIVGIDEEMEDVLLHLKTLYDVCMDGVTPYLEKNFEKLIKY